MNQATQELDEARRQTARARAVRPPVDVFEDNERIALYADLPGVGQDQLNITVDGQMLTIEASANLPTPGSMKVAYAEFRTPRYVREFSLSSELNAERIEATLRNGVLTLSIPKQEHAKPKKISVQVL